MVLNWCYAHHGWNVDVVCGHTPSRDRSPDQQGNGARDSSGCLLSFLLSSKLIGIEKQLRQLHPKSSRAIGPHAPFLPTDPGIGSRNECRQLQPQSSGTSSFPFPSRRCQMCQTAVPFLSLPRLSSIPGTKMSLQRVEPVVAPPFV